MKIKKIKLAYIAFVRMPTEKAHGVQIMKTCEAFAGEQVEVDLVVPNRKSHIKEDPFVYYEVQRNFSISYRSVFDAVQWGSVGFMISALLFSESAKWSKAFKKADIIYSRDAFVLFQYLLLQRKLVYEAHTKPTWISTFVAKHTCKLVVISEGLRDAYIDAGVAKDKIIVAHDAIDPELFTRKYDKQKERQLLGMPTNKKIALYVGKIDEEKGADTFAAASEYVGGELLCVLIGPESTQKKELKERYPKALFLPETPYRDLPRILSTADMLVLPNSSKDKNASIYTSPLKAFAYMATGKPIIASDVPSLRAIFSNSVAYFTPDDSKSLSNTLSDLNFREPQIPFTWSDRASTILATLKQLI